MGLEVIFQLKLLGQQSRPIKQTTFVLLHLPGFALPSLREKHDEYHLLRELLKSWANQEFG
ncbi:hypothetical protein CUMW_204550 [Citrus unshiu]|uniref:Uncharacterized protein n=1 Tax=Citrus unshiu TaxID=55188 RepID=A0A2H5Q7Z5_CITUN|nr:hypothetical protein CUMW_204550 [Citrus unshiu]